MQRFESALLGARQARSARWLVSTGTRLLRRCVAGEKQPPTSKATLEECNRTAHSLEARLFASRSWDLAGDEENVISKPESDRPIPPAV